MDKKIYYFEKLNNSITKHFVKFGNLSDEEFETLKNLAVEEFKKQTLTETQTAALFENNTTFNSVSDLHGFYFCGKTFKNNNVNYNLHAIVFKKNYEYDKKTFEARFIGYIAIAIYKDSNSNLYQHTSLKIDRLPLDDWQKELSEEIETATAKIEILKKAKQVYKKDGTPFNNISKNFENITVIENYDALKICYNGNYNNKYYADTIYNCEKYPLNNIFDVIPAIKNYINYLTEYAEQKKKILQNSEMIYFDFMSPVYEKIAKWQTPSNNCGFNIDYFYYTVKKFIEKAYIHF